MVSREVNLSAVWSGRAAQSPVDSRGQSPTCPDGRGQEVGWEAGARAKEAAPEHGPFGQAFKELLNISLGYPKNTRLSDFFFKATNVLL